MLTARAALTLVLLVLAAPATTAYAGSPAPISDWLPDPTYGHNGAVTLPANAGVIQVRRAGDGLLFSNTTLDDAQGTETTAFSTATLTGDLLGSGKVVTYTRQPQSNLLGPLTIDAQRRPYFTFTEPPATSTTPQTLVRLDPGYTTLDLGYDVRVTNSQRPSILVAAAQGDRVLVSLGRRRGTGTAAGTGRIVRLMPDGRIDTTFGNGGFIDTPAAASCLTARMDGTFAASYPTTMVSYDQAGIPEPAFGRAGTVDATTHIAAGVFDLCPIAMRDGSLVATTFKRKKDIASSKLMHIARDGRVVSRQLVDFVTDLAQRDDGAILTTLALRELTPPWFDGAGVKAIRAFDAGLNPLPTGAHPTAYIPSFAALGNSRMGNQIVPIALSDGRHVLVPLRSDTHQVQYARIVLGAAHADPAEAPVARPRLTVRSTGLATQQSVTVRYTCPAGCQIARYDARTFIDGRLRTQLPPGLLDSHQQLRFHDSFPLTITDRKTKYLQRTLGFRFQIATTDGFGRRASARISYRLRCTYRLVQPNLASSRCRRISPIRTS
ncbi:MAG: hypothetical protein JWP07_4530 [Pseudonocardiales bacterium]|nr:hypothetical protein [Pseudonocardiales bacterium]